MINYIIIFFSCFSLMIISLNILFKLEKVESVNL